MDVPPNARRTVAVLGRAGFALGRAGFAVTAATTAANLLAYLVPLLGARSLAPADLGALATAMALVAIATMPGIGLQTAVAVAVARCGGSAAAGRGAARLSWITAAGCGGTVLLATPVIAGSLRLPVAVPPLLAAMTVPAVLAGWPLGVMQGGERFGRLAAGTVLLAAGRYGGVLAGLAAGAGVTGAVALGALVAWSVPPALWWLQRSPAGEQDRHAPAAKHEPAGRHGPHAAAGKQDQHAAPDRQDPHASAAGHGPHAAADRQDPAAAAGALRGRAVFAAASASLAILVASYADLILARRLLPAGESGAYAVGAVLTRAAIWAPQVITIVALPRLARGRGAGLRVGLTLVGAAGAALVAATAVTGDSAARAVGGVRYAAELGRLAPYFVLVGALYAVTVFLVNAQLAAGTRWPSAGVWAVVAGLLALVAVVRPATVAQLLACAVGAAAASVLATGAAVWWHRSTGPPTASSLPLDSTQN